MSSITDRVVQIATRRSWLSVGLRHRLIHVACPERPVSFETNVFGCRYAGRLDSYIDREVFFLGSYEPVVLDLLARLVVHRDNAVLLDVGANVGQHTLFAARHYGQVHAFEPYPPLVKILRKQISRNGFTHVHVHAVGLGDEDGDAPFAAPADGRAGYGGFDNRDPNLQRHMLPLRRGDTYLASIGLTRVDVVKIDVEGSERRVVAGLAGVLTQHRPALVFEYWPHAWPERIERLLPSDYRVWAVHERGTVWGIFSQPTGSLRPMANVKDGSTVLALPGEWPVPLSG